LAKSEIAEIQIAEILGALYPVVKQRGKRRWT